MTQYVRRGSTIALAGGMRDLAFFRGGIRDLSRKQCWEAEISISSGSGIFCFYGVGMRDWEGEKSGIRDFNSVSGFK